MISSVKEKIETSDPKPVFLVFHGGSGSSKQEARLHCFRQHAKLTMGQFSEAISNGVVKVNLDTDLQWACKYCRISHLCVLSDTDLSGIRDYILNKKDYLMTQVGNPEGPGKRTSHLPFQDTMLILLANKKFYDPRVWVREGEKTMTTRVKEALQDFDAAGQL